MFRLFFNFLLSSRSCDHIDSIPFRLIMARNCFYFFNVLSICARGCVVYFLNFLLPRRSCDHIDSGSARESSKKISGAKLWGAQLLVHDDDIKDFHAKYEMCEIDKFNNVAMKIDLQSVSDINIHLGPAMRATFKISSEPNARPMRVDCS